MAGIVPHGENPTTVQRCRATCHFGQMAAVEAVFCVRLPYVSGTPTETKKAGSVVLEVGHVDASTSAPSGAPGACAGLVGAGLVAEPAQATVYVGQLGNGPGEYTYTVPPGLTSLTVVLVGGAGGSFPDEQDPLWDGDTGAFLQGTFTVTPGQQLSG
jgi:hypothetical protein